jgi:hypothetical protein
MIFLTTMKSFLAILCVALIAIVAADSIPECNHYNCPPYTVLSSDTDASVEIRQYNSVRWVRTAVQSFYYDDAVNIGFNRLFDYIAGANADGIAIPMTAPVATQVIPGAGPFCESTFIISFFVPDMYQTPNPPPPTPTDDTVFVETLPQTVKAVYMFPGYIMKWDQLIAPITDLVTYCTAAGYEFVPNIETVAGYDSPFHLFDRHNEIWIDIWNY